MGNKYLNLYELTRWMYIEKYIDIFEMKRINISKKDLEENYSQVFSKKYTRFPVVVPKQNAASTLDEVTHYIVFEQNDSNCVIIPQDDIDGHEKSVLQPDNLDGSVFLISEEAVINSFKAKNEETTSKELSRNLSFQAFKKRFERYTKELLSEILETQNALQLFKVNGEYQFSLLDYHFFEFLYDTYETQGKYLLRGNYKQISPGYIQCVLHDLEVIMEQHQLNIDMTHIKKKFNIVLLIAEKNNLKSSLMLLEKIVTQIANIPEDNDIIPKIEFVQSNNEIIMECYQKIFSNSPKYLI